MINLTVEFDVLKYSPAGFDYPTDSFCDLIPQYELEMRRECIGRVLWDFMVSKIVPYPGIVSEWDSSVQYNIGDVVIRNFCTYTSTAVNNVSDPLDSSTWTPYKRFSHAGANELWTGFLRQIMAYKVFMGSLTSATYRAGAGGMTINGGDQSGVRAPNKQEFLTNLSQYQYIVELTTTNMKEWLNEFYKVKELPIAACSANNCDIPINRSRRVALRDDDF